MLKATVTKLQRLAIYLRKRPVLVAVAALTVVVCLRLIGMGILTYGDIPLFDVQRSGVNAWYIWGDEQLGTNVRQGLNTLRDSLLHLVSWNNTVFYFLKYILPILLIPITYYALLRRLHITQPLALLIGSLLPLFTPIVFGDFLSGQTFWIYLTIPWTFYFATSIFCWGNFRLKNYILFGLMLFLSLGMLPPIIVPLCIALLLFIATIFVVNLPNINGALLRKYVVAGLVIGVTFGALAYPYIVAGSSGQAAFAPSSLLGDYYHNYASTDLVNTLRLSGNNGSGQTTLGYNIFSGQNAWGYIFVIGIGIGAWLLLSEKNRRGNLAVRNLIYASLVTTLCIIGFMHLMANDTAFGISIFESQWIVSTIRNPSKLYVLLLPLFVILFSLSLQAALEKLTNVRLRWIVAATAIIAILAYGWPALRGDFGLLAGDGKKMSTYKPDPVLQQINQVLSDNPHERSILIPSSHRDELNYEKLSPGLKTLGLQGSLAGSAKVISQTNSTLNAQNKYFFNYIDALGVKNVFAKNKAQAYENIPFSLFSVKTTPDSVNNFLQKELAIKGKTADYTHYVNDQANDKLFAAQNIVNLASDDQLVSKAAFMQKNTAVISRADSKYTHLAKSYETTKQPASTKNTDGKVQLHDPTLVIADLYVKNEGGKRLAYIEILHPFTNQVQEQRQFDVASTASVATINGQRHTFSEAKKRISMRAGAQEIVFSSVEPLSTRNLDASFEEDTEASDGEKGKAGKPEIYAQRVTDKTEGNHSLLLGTKNHVAFVEKKLPTLEPNSDYIISFDYKNIAGQSPRYAVINTANKQQTSLASSTLDPVPAWTTHEIFLNVKDPTSVVKEKSKISLFLYSDTDKAGQASENIFDNLRVYKLHQTNVHKAAIDSYQPDYNLQDYQIDSTKSPEKNLLNNASFEDAALWGKVQDATPGTNGTAKLAAEQSRDHISGQHSLALKSSSHTAYVSKKVNSFKPNTIYKVAFHYKNISGEAPAFAVWQSGAQISSPRANLTANKDWTYFETFFIPDQAATGLQLYLYSSSRGNETVNLFDDVIIAETSAVSQYLIKTSDAQLPPSQFIKGYAVKNPAHVEVTLQEGRGMLVWNESFDKGWKAFLTKKDGSRKLLDPGSHVVVNGFANGWWIDSETFSGEDMPTGNYTIDLMYTPQQRFTKYLTFSLALFGMLTLYIIISGTKRYRHKTVRRRD